ncbi:COX15/CtaA family protein [Dietzia sp.]|uniref:COX15/CtaA family protein n=1 Tax=Dietzia sp. TaxID=1871616 RepID=UPI002FD9E4DA
MLSRLPVPSSRTLWWLALLNLICQIGIMGTGAIVRVTASGLGCEEWPRCNQDSFVPVAGAAPWVHQLIEFGNRTLTIVLTVVAVLLLLAVLRAGRRTELKALAWIMPFGILAQGIIGGITVLAGLLWWTVALHLVPSLLLAACAAVLFVRIQEPDDAPVRVLAGSRFRSGIVLSGALLAAVLVAGTLVTGAGPHAGDGRVKAEDRLQVDIDLLAHIHGELMAVYLILVVALVVIAFRKGMDRVVRRRGIVLVCGILAQGAIGLIQYFTGVPEALVVLHVLGAGLVTALTAILWAGCRVRRPEPGPELA